MKLRTELKLEADEVLDMTFEDESWIGVKVNQGSLSCSMFINCQFTDVVFQKMWLEHVLFQKCNFKNVKIIECEITGIEFSDCTGEISPLAF